VHIHLIHAHPEPRSFVTAMRDTIVAEFESRGDDVTTSDLYTTSFNPVATKLKEADKQKKRRRYALVMTTSVAARKEAGPLVQSSG
jgi:putative NADPH-quinone reductase